MSVAATAAPISAEHLSKTFGDACAVDGVDLEVPEGSIVGLIGPSGCGKTTTVRLLNGAYRPSAGAARLFGRDPTKLTTEEKQRVGYLPQIPIEFPNLTVWENLAFQASVYGVPLRHRRRRLRDVLELVELEGQERKRVNQLSGGMQRRLALAGALAHNPSVLFLDEPTAGIDPILRRKFWDRFHQLRDEGRALLITTQYVGEAAECDVVGVMSDGQLIALSTPDELRRRASGGDMVDVITRAPLREDALDAVTQLPMVRGIRPIGLTTYRTIVTDAGRGQAQVLGVLHDFDVDVISTTEVTPDYDDVFVQIVQQHRAERAAEAQADSEAA